MSLRKELEAVTEPSSHSHRKVDLILDQLDEDEAVELREILADPFIEGSAIARLLRKRGYHISDRAVQRYRSDNELA